MYAFEYHRPKTVAEAVSLLQGASDGKLLAGGHTLIPTLKQRLAQPSDIIDLGAIGASAAVINAITDAIGHNKLEMPATPDRVWRAIHG